MTADPQAAQPTSQPPVSGSPVGNLPSPSGFALLAKRLWNWTTNCIVTALVLVLGLGFGRQVIRWWTLDAPGDPMSHAPPQPGSGLGDLVRPHEIRFGHHTWRIRRESVAGSREQAMAGLRSSCRVATQASTPPLSSALQGEQHLLDVLRQRTPTDHEPGKWGIYEVDDHFPTVVGIREPDSVPPPTLGKSISQKGCRVVTWGLAVPMSAGAWTLYTFHQTAPSNGESPEFEPPPNGKALLALEVEGGGMLTAVRGSARAETWKSFYDQWFESRGWTAGGGWHQFGRTWSKHYQEKSEGPAGTTDVQFGEDGGGGLSGLLLFTPAPDKLHGK